MKRIFLLIAVCIGNICTAQQKDTIVVKGQKGFLFLTEYNYQYDWREGDEMRPLGFHDFFFPGEYPDSLLFLDSNKAITFKNGLRVDYIDNRLPLKQKAMLFQGKDSTWCYGYNQFYVIPIIISYKQCNDYEPLVCKHSYFDIQVAGGSALHFEYEYQMIKPTEIIPIGRKGKPKTKKARK